MFYGSKPSLFMVLGSKGSIYPKSICYMSTHICRSLSVPPTRFLTILQSCLVEIERWITCAMIPIPIFCSMNPNMTQNTLVVLEDVFNGHILKFPVMCCFGRSCIFPNLEKPSILRSLGDFQVFPSGSGSKSGKSLERARGRFCWGKDGWVNTLRIRFPPLKNAWNAKCPIF